MKFFRLFESWNQHTHIFIWGIQTVSCLLLVTVFISSVVFVGLRHKVRNIINIISNEQTNKWRWWLCWIEIPRVYENHNIHFYSDVGSCFKVTQISCVRFYLNMYGLENLIKIFQEYFDTFDRYDKFDTSVNAIWKYYLKFYE